MAASTLPSTMGSSTYSDNLKDFYLTTIQP
jgi:hypothetical protein